MVRRWVWICVLLLWDTSLSIQITDPVLYYNSLPELNNIYYENCAPEVACDPTAVYRTANGSCNNLAHTSWGSSLTPFIRLAKPVFDDDVNKIRQRQMYGSILPGPRDIQVKLFLYRSQDFPDLFYNVHFAQLGQWITHDITSLPPRTTGPKDCCREQFPETIPECQTIIKIPIHDPVYGNSGRRCMNNKRLITSDSFNCDITPPIAMNLATSFMDASQLYGHESATSTRIRAFVGGKLLTDIINGQEFCPQQKRNGSTLCNERPGVGYCFLAGDGRVNQHFGITAYQTIFTRFHNKLVDQLHCINSKWSDEKLYQEGRKIMAAIHQILTYCHYLPRLLGEEYTKSVGLSIDECERTVYNSSLMPQLTVEFSAGVFRLPHNTIVTQYNFINENNQVFNSPYLNEWMMKPDPLVVPRNFDGLIRGMILSAKRAPVHSYNYQISNFMYHNFLPNKRDQDLLSVDIERGRESGIAKYNTAREICGYPKAKTFMDFTDILKESDALKLQDVYATPDDVDLLVGALLEPPCPGAMVGTISRSIIADVFYRIRYSDSKFFDIQDQPGSFSDQQLEALRKIDLGLIFCATTGVQEVPTDIFAHLPLESMQSCQERLLNLDLSAWKDTQ